MIPRSDLDLSAQIPAEAKYWLPARDDLEDDEGFGFFRDVWPILDVSFNQAKAQLADDERLVKLVAEAANNADEFDALAKAVEAGDVDDLASLLSGKPQDLLTAIAPDEIVVDGLELGVAGLVYALSASGCFPAASCRGHVGPHAWASEPVVFVACDRTAAEGLTSFVAAAACGFDIDPARPELLALTANSVEDTLNLAELLLGRVLS
jgi:hypothetical protein